MISILIALINSMSVVIVAAYILSRMKFFCDVVDGRSSAGNQALLTLIFGLFSVYGTISGFSIVGAVANTRYIGPLLAGIIGGPLVGLGTGLIGGIHRYASGGFTYVESAISTVVAGLVAGLVFNKGRFRRNGLISIGAAGILSVVILIYHYGQILVFCKPADKAAILVQSIAIPMTLSNAGGVVIFLYIINNLFGERRTKKERDEYLQAKERIESELRIATDIQMSMVPRVFTVVPSRPEFDLFATMVPAKEVGGDFYDFFVLGDHLFFSVGDVSDKGVPAALLMAVTKTLLKSSAAHNPSPADIFAKVNRELSANNESMMFVTCFCAKFNYKTGELTFSNAGHNPPILIRRSGPTGLLGLPEGLVLGAMDNAKYRDETVTLLPGDCIVAYTDGVTEAMDKDGRLFSTGRLIDVARKSGAAAARDIVEIIAASVHDYASGAAQSDDITVLAMHYSGPEGQ
ncbi:MAG: SpoIIE family protein phosphatase [Nitrospiraceae bacterium]|nr:SpoIIE family protein phosphatase [Nitrospiraceae bacterium]